jgi:predicted nuclease of restriction endonuclease-like (RecB) superfamily
MIDLYWNIGEYITKKIEIAEWGDSVVAELANYIKKNDPEIKGFSDKNLWRMKQFFETYKNHPNLSTALREISWSHNLAIFSRCKSNEERAFYLRKLIKKGIHFENLIGRFLPAFLNER